MPLSHLQQVSGQDRTGKEVQYCAIIQKNTCVHSTGKYPIIQVWIYSKYSRTRWEPLQGAEKDKYPGI
ncbi:MAG TPA: hypothetical protein ENH91_11325 [Leeuwenhoekiella sp.]|nr:hypothetical protein [Leeuwenhoekiella sp.]